MVEVSRGNTNVVPTHADNRTRRKSLKECIYNFTWAWHTVIMGTGSLSSLSYRFHFGTDSLGLKIFTLTLFFLNLILFVIVCGFTIARYCLFPELWSKSLRHPIHGLYVGAFPMGAATLITGALAVRDNWNFGGRGFLYTLWAFWWADLAISFLIAFGMLHIAFQVKHQTTDTVISLWILPVVTLIVASSAGALLGEALIPYSTFHALLSTAVSCTALMIGLTLAIMIVTFYLLRLFLHGIPDINLSLSAFVILGPFGQGGFSMLVNGNNLSALFPNIPGTTLPPAQLVGQVLYVVLLAGAWIMWCIGLTWFILALFSTRTITRSARIPFSLSYWGIIFPSGVYGLLSVQLGVVLNNSFFQYFGVIWSVALFIIWVFVVIRTIFAIWDTSIFAGPRVSTNIDGTFVKEEIKPADLRC